MTDTPILHVDMDAFFASVATRGRPELEGRPVLVGGQGRGVVLAASYAAREHGVRSGMPMARARRVCPHAVVVAPDYDAFSSVSRAVMDHFRQVTPLVETASLDEAFLDVRGSTRRLGTVEQIAERIRGVVHDEQGITCSVGAAATVSVAKVASRRAKPDGVLVVRPDEVPAFLHPLDVGELWGVGEKTRKLLHARGYVTVADLARAEPSRLQDELGRHLGAQLHALAHGADRDRLDVRQGTHEVAKSMGADETFARDSDERAFVVRELLRLSAKVAARMRAAGLVGRTVAVRLRFSDFTTITRAHTLAQATDVTVEVHAAATRLFDAHGAGRGALRLVGVRVEGLVPREQVHPQLVLGQRDRGWPEADRAVDSASRRFGSTAVRPATLVPSGGARGVNVPNAYPVLGERA